MEDPDIDEPLVLASSSGPSAPVDAEKLENLGNMGFSPNHARKALKETGGDMERAVDWLFSHPDDQGDVEEGAEAADAERPKETPGSDALPARFELQSIICHKGGSIHAG
jgi:ubiquitin carboxyl-terminal hydrolase 5/13